jgi:hypothetical protein
MVLGVTIFVVAILIIAIWVIIEMKRMRHKMFAIFLIGLILFSYLSFSFVFKDEEVNLTSVEGLEKAAGLYFSWFGSIFSNLKTMTANAIDMNWKGNETG